MRRPGGIPDGIVGRLNFGSCSCFRTALLAYATALGFGLGLNRVRADGKRIFLAGESNFGEAFVAIGAGADLRNVVGRFLVQIHNLSGDRGDNFAGFNDVHFNRGAGPFPSRFIPHDSHG